MKKQMTAIIALTMITTLSFGQSIPRQISESDFTIGKSIQIESTVLGEPRDLNIYLPHGYADDSLKTYPVIYLLDGSKDEDFIHIAGLVQFGSFGWINLVPESIVVGIGNVDRKRDFTYPSTSEVDKKELPTSGHSAKFIQFIKEELQPFVETTFNTGDNKTIIGQSLGGLLATEILFKAPDLFDQYIIVSPSLWWDNEKLLKEQPLPYQTEKSIYIAVGKEGEIMERTAKQLYDKLNLDKKEHTKLFFDFLEDKTHGDALHIAVYNAFEKLFIKEADD